MLSVPIPFTPASFDFSLPLPGLPVWVRVLLVLALTGAVVAVLVLLLRRELKLVRRRVAFILMALRMAAVLAVFLTLVADPTLVTTTSTPVRGRVLVAVDTSDSLRVADPQRPADGQRKIADTLKLADVATVPRLKLAERILTPDGADLLGELAKTHDVEAVAFDQTTRSLPVEPNPLKAKLDADRLLAVSAGGGDLVYTDLKLPLARAADTADSPASKLVGVVLLTDGRHNWGDSPAVRVREFAARGVPVYPVALAPAVAPPDVAVVAAQPQTSVVFKGSTVPVEVQVRVSGWPAGVIAVRMDLPPDESGKPRPPVTESFVHGGADETYTVVLRAKLDTPGPLSLVISAEAKGGEDKFPANNRRTVRVNVVKDRARVLLVDGEARWEFHYLHTCLGRDDNMDVRSVVFRQPRITKATDDDLKKFGTPARTLPDADTLGGYDCVILGDVEPSQMRDWAWLEKYVAEDGGTLVVVAGKRAVPLQYTADADPLRKLLPISDPTEYAVKNGFRLALTPDGRRSWFLSLGDSAAATREAWEGLPVHYWAVAGKPKDGAEVLAEANGAAVMARHNYGFGRVLYVGVDSTWRWRYKVGDKWHHKFWGQVAQWAASDRLLPAQNPAGTIRFGTREPAYRTGQEVEVLARGSDEVKKLGPNSLKGARVVRLADKDGGAETAVGLTPLTTPDGRPRDVAGKVRNLPPGQYAVELEIPDWADQLQGAVGPDGRAAKLRSPFEVLPPDNEEVIELTADVQMLDDIASTSGGRVYQPHEVEELVRQLSAKVATVDTRTEHPARKSWLTLAFVLILLGAEWGVRKWAGLP